MGRQPCNPCQRVDGDGWVTCREGHQHWGRYGAAGLLLAHEGRVLLQHRAEWSHQGGTWSIPGGARASHEDPLAAALREAHEEARVPAAMVDPLASYVEDHHSWSYTTIVATTDRGFQPAAGDAESVALEWVLIAAVDQRPLHPAFAAAWPVLCDLLDRRMVIMVDAANVVGSVPDGWWRDRAAATERLRDRLVRLTSTGMRADAFGPNPLDQAVERIWPLLVLVTEGPARSVGATSGVEVVAAPDDGDSKIVELVHRHRRLHPADAIYVATADRELRVRVGHAGGWPMAPGTLLGLLD